MSGSGPSGILLHVERVVMEAVLESLAAEPRRRLETQLGQVGRVQRPRSLPELSLCAVRDDGSDWSVDVLFPRRDEFVLASVHLRVEGSLHECEVMAVNGRVFAIVARPPVAPGSERVEVEAVRPGDDPMVATRGRPRRRPVTERPSRAVKGTMERAAGRGFRGRPESHDGTWTVLLPRSEREPVERSVLAVGRGGALLVGSRERARERYRLVAPSGVPIRLRAEDLGAALREATALLRE